MGIIFNGKELKNISTIPNHDFETVITVSSNKFDTKTEYKLCDFEINNDKLDEIVNCMFYLLQDLIEEKHEAREGKKRKKK